MLAIAISLLFGLAAFAALAAFASALFSGARRTRSIMAELAEIERRARVSRPRPALSRPRAVLLPALAAA